MVHNVTTSLPAISSQIRYNSVKSKLQELRRPQSLLKALKITRQRRIQIRLEVDIQPKTADSLRSISQNDISSPHALGKYVASIQMFAVFCDDPILLSVRVKLLEFLRSERIYPRGSLTTSTFFEQCVSLTYLLV